METFICTCDVVTFRKKKFKVVDYFEGCRDLVGYADNITEIKKLARHYLNEVTEEALLFYYPLNEKTGKYDFSKRELVHV